MEIIEKQTEKIKEVPCGYWDNNCGYRNNSPYASKGVGGTGLGLGIAGTALGLLALSRNGFNLFGNNSNVPENVNINTFSGAGAGTSIPTTFQAWQKSCEEGYLAQKNLYDFAVLSQNQRFNDRQTLDAELFSLYKGQTDADFNLYKSMRDGFDIATSQNNRNFFDLYKTTRDADDAIYKELSDLKAQVAVNAAVRPYQDKLIQCEIDKAFTAGVNYTDRKTCKAIYGELVLPSTPTVTGYAGINPCSCGAPVVVSNS